MIGSVMRLLPLLALLLTGARTAPARDPEFAAAVAELSEPGGFFFSDNLISNETSYLHVIPRLEALGVEGGAYIGVGPEQNFSYIARIRPAVAFIVDIRRDNLLLQLFLKAAIERAPTRLEYLCLLYARPCPADPAPWRDRPLDDLTGYIDTQSADSAFRAESDRALYAVMDGFGVPVSPAEYVTLTRLHDEFVTMGLDLRFTAYGGRVIGRFPTVRDLYGARDLDGARRSFLADDAAYQVVRRLQLANRIIPVVGDLGGDHALRAVGRWLARHDRRLSLFYLSNVEFYLMRQGTFDRFVANLETIPAAPNAMLTRSYFGVQTGLIHPDQQPGHLSVQLLQPVTRFLEIAKSPDLTYWRLMTEGMESLHQ